jgi:hypothetical protein
MPLGVGSVCTWADGYACGGLADCHAYRGLAHGSRFGICDTHACLHLNTDANAHEHTRTNGYADPGTSQHTNAYANTHGNSD